METVRLSLNTFDINEETKKDIALAKQIDNIQNMEYKEKN
jgi:pterin-4a-carbinolamine dehydratase